MISCIPDLEDSFRDITKGLGHVTDAPNPCSADIKNLAKSLKCLSETLERLYTMKATNAACWGAQPMIGHQMEHDAAHKA